MLFRTMKTFAFGLTLSALVLPACVTAGKYKLLEDELARTQEELSRANNELESAQDMLVDTEGKQSALQDRANLADQLATENAKLTAQVKELMEKNKVVAPDGTVLVVHDGAYGYQMKADVVFSPGSDQLTKKGESILKDVADQLKKNDKQIIVEGHTDSDPINKTAEKWPRGNIQLGAGRAMSVKEFLVKQGVEESRMAIASYGPFRPVDSGKSAAAKARNRRVEIMVRAIEPSENKG